MKTFAHIFATILILISEKAVSQDSTFVLSTSMMNDLYQIRISEFDGWVFQEGHNASWAEPDLNTSDWQPIKPLDLNSSMANEDGRLEGWFRLKVRLDSTFTHHFPGVGSVAWAASEIYIDGELIQAFGRTGNDENLFQEYRHSLTEIFPIPTKMAPGEDHVIAIHFVDYVNAFSGELKSQLTGLSRFVLLTGPGNWESFVEKSIFLNRIIFTLTVTVGLLVLFLWLLTIINKERYLLFVSIGNTFLFLFAFGILLEQMGALSFYPSYIVSLLLGPFVAGFILSLPVINAEVFENRVPKGIGLITLVLAILMVLHSFFPIPTFPIPVVIVSLSICLYYPIRFRKSVAGAKWAIVAGLVLFLTSLLTVGLLFQFGVLTPGGPALLSIMAMFSVFPLSLLVYVSFRFREMILEEKQNSLDLVKLNKEKKKILEDQNLQLEKQVKVRTSELNQSLEDLKATQSQLIQSEKMASLGELTAGIAHEIQNPLNFVNNFSDVNKELIQEIQDERQKTKDRDEELEGELLRDIGDNMEKINHHGLRADAIVKGMLQHSRESGGEKEPTDINALADKYLRLSFHGLRAKDKSFNADFKLEPDESLPKVNAVPQDLGRVLLNLINNAFHAVNERAQKESGTYKPTVTVSTSMSPLPSRPPAGRAGQASSRGVKGEEKVQVTVSDNGSGIPDSIRDKIFQPFFTTKPTGEGTGLGLSLSYDIVTKGHGGTIEVKSDPGKRTEFLIKLPIGDQ